MRARAPAPGEAGTQEWPEQPEHQQSKRALSNGARASRGAATQERPEHQHSKRIGSCKSLMPLLARCAGSPGGWSWERFGRVPWLKHVSKHRKSRLKLFENRVKPFPYRLELYEHRFRYARSERYREVVWKSIRN